MVMRILSKFVLAAFLLFGVNCSLASVSPMQEMNIKTDEGNASSDDDSDLKPVIYSIDNLQVVENDYRSFYLLFDVRFSGADRISVEVEEEYNTSVRNYWFYGDGLAHVKTGNITSLYNSWVSVFVENEYGTVSETMEFAPTAGVDASCLSAQDSLKEIVLYNADGRTVFSGTPSEFRDKAFRSGLYIKKEIFENGSSQTSKIFF